MSKKQTAVEWFELKLNAKLKDGLESWIWDLIDQAKAIEKEQIIESRATSPMTSGDVMLDRAEAEQYYTETYEQ